MDLSEKVTIVTKLQKTSYDVFSTITQSLQPGMSEVHIAEMIRLEFSKKGIDEYWYSVPCNVLIGADRFCDGTTTTDYIVKNPTETVSLTEGSPIFIDLSPMDPEKKVWGDWARTIVYRPRKEIDDEQIDFLREFSTIQREGISHITAKTTGADVVNYYLAVFRKKDITLSDVRNNVGHSIHVGLKEKAERTWLDEGNINPLGEGIFTIEPGGYRNKKDGKGVVVARFEECIYIPSNGNAVILGNTRELPFFV